MFEVLIALFWGIMGLTSAGACIIFALCTLVAVATIFLTWTDKDIEIKERCWVTVALCAFVVWGSWLTWLAGHYATEWLV